MVIWIVGLSGSGKTTLAKKAVNRIRGNKKKVALVDGDEIRNLYSNDLGHDISSRKKNSLRICNLCKYLDSQEINVVCSILSIFPEDRQWCRDNLSKYYEVFIDTPIAILKARDSKSIYSRYQKGEIKEVVGFDIPFPRPEKPDLQISNDTNLDIFLSHADKLAKLIKE